MGTADLSVTVDLGPEDHFGVSSDSVFVNDL